MASERELGRRFGLLWTAFGVRAPVITGGGILLVSLALIPRLGVVVAAANATAVHEKPQTTSSAGHRAPDGV